MRIFYVTMEFMNPETLELRNGGMSHYLYKTARSLLDKGHDVNIVMGADRNGYVKYRRINVHFVKVTDGPFSFFKRMFFMTRQKALFNKKFGHLEKIRDFIASQHRKNPIDIVQYPNTKGLAKFANKKIPYCIRASNYVRLQQKHNDYHDALEERVEIEIDRSSPFMFSQSKKISDAMLADGIIKEPLPIIEPPAVPFNSDKELPKFAYTIKDRTGGANYMLYFGTICKKNGIVEMADCIYEILKKYPDLYFVFIGRVLNPEDGLISLLKTKAAEFSSRVLCYDKQHHKYLYPVLKRAFGVVIPAIYKNFTNSCVEAMMQRKIVIATEENYGHLIKDGENGFLCKAGDVSGLQSKIEEFLELSPEKKYEIEQAAFNTTKQFSAPIISKQLIDYYQHVIDNWKD